VTLRRLAQRGGVAALSRRLPSLLSQRVCIRRRGEWVLDSDNACGTPHDRALNPGAGRFLSGSIQVGWRRSPRLAAKGAPWSGENPTVLVAHPRLCALLVVGGPQVLSSPPGRGDGPRNAVCGPWGGGGGGGGGGWVSMSLILETNADPFRLQDVYASFKHRPGRLG